LKKALTKFYQHTILKVVLKRYIYNKYDRNVSLKTDNKVMRACNFSAIAEEGRAFYFLKAKMMNS